MQSEVQWATNLVGQYLKEGWRIEAIETPVALLDQVSDEITKGCIDLVLEHENDYLLIDWKTGDKGDYSAQMAGYQMAWWDLHEVKSVQCQIAYVDLQEIVDCSQSYGRATERVLKLYEQWQERRKEPYTINQYCDWCALRPLCPAWIALADTTLSMVTRLEGLPAKIDALKSDPLKLETFMLGWERTKTLIDDVWALKEALKTHLELGYKAQHYTLVSVNKQETTIDPEAFLQKIADEIGTMRAAQCIKVDPDKALDQWREYSKDPFPVEIKTVDKPGYTYLKRKGKPGAGAARAKRKELE